MQISVWNGASMSLTTRLYKEVIELGKNWNNIWKDNDKLRRWSIPDKYFLNFVNDIEIIPNEYNVLDIGCGVGRHSLYFAKKGANVLALDNSEACMEYLLNETKKINVKIDLELNDFKKLPFIESNTQDLIICWNALYHNKFDAMKDMLREVYRILKSNGILIITFLSSNNIHYGEGIEIEKNTFSDQDRLDNEHFHHYSNKEEVYQLLKDFEITDIIEAEEEVGGKFFEERWHWYIKCKGREKNEQ